MPDIQFQVYGINLLVRLMAEPPADVRVHCPKGSPIRYGEVVGPRRRLRRGRQCLPRDAADPHGRGLRGEPRGGGGHYFYIAGEEHRVIRLDAVILSFPLE